MTISRIRMAPEVCRAAMCNFTGRLYRHETNLDRGNLDDLLGR